MEYSENHWPGTRGDSNYNFTQLKPAGVGHQTVSGTQAGGEKMNYTGCWTGVLQLNTAGQTKNQWQKAEDRLTETTKQTQTFYKGRWLTSGRNKTIDWCTFSLQCKARTLFSRCLNEAPTIGFNKWEIQLSAVHRLLDLIMAPLWTWSIFPVSGTIKQEMIQRAFSQSSDAFSVERQKWASSAPDWANSWNKSVRGIQGKIYLSEPWDSQP